MTIFNYTVNYIDLLIVGIVIFFAVIGSFRGIALTIVHFLRYSIGLPLCFIASIKTAQPIYDTYLKQYVYDWVKDKMMIDNDFDKIAAQIKDSLNSLPNLITDSLNISSDAFQSLESGKDITNYIADTIIQPVALIAVKIIIFVAVFIIFFGITGLIVSLVRKRNQKKRREKGKKTLKNIDRIIGCVFGILKGAVIAFAFVSIVNIILTDFDYSSSKFLNTANDSILFNDIVKFNPFNFITEDIV